MAFSTRYNLKTCVIISNKRHARMTLKRDYKNYHEKPQMLQFFGLSG